MSGSVNKVVVIGRLSRDPELRTFQNGNKACNMTVVTSEKWKDKSSGEKKERAEFHRIQIFNDNLVGVAERFLRKGSLVYIEGQLETRKASTQDGERYFTEIVLRPYRGELTLLDSPSDGQRGALAGEQGRVATSEARSAKRAPEGSAGFDDEIPF